MRARTRQHTHDIARYRSRLITGHGVTETRSVESNRPIIRQAGRLVADSSDKYSPRNACESDKQSNGAR